MSTVAKAIKRTPAKKPSSPRRLRLRFTVVVEKDGQAWHAYCPAFRGLHVDGDTEQEAVRNAVEAAQVFINSLSAHGEPLPVGPHCSLDEEERFSVPAGALLRRVEVQWPSESRSGTS
jgi:predicted RNase H-like HicB family nuclease